MLIKGLLFFDLKLLKCWSKVFSTSIWSCWNVEQRFSLLRFGVVEMSIKGLLYFDLDLLKCRSKVFLTSIFDLELLKCWSKVFSTSIWSCWNVDQRSSLLQPGVVEMSIKGLRSEVVEMSIKGLLYFDLKLLKCRSKVFSTLIWSCWNVDQRFSLLWSEVIEMSIKGLCCFDLKLLTTKSQNLGLDFNDECFVVPLLLGWVIFIYSFLIWTLSRKV